MAIFFVAVLNAQPPKHFVHFSERDGLSDMRVNCLLRDSQGFLWVGTENGLNRFDGYSFRNFSSEQKESHEAFRGGEAISAMVMDGKGRVWIGTNQGLNRYDPASSAFEYWSEKGGNGVGLPNPTVMTLAMDSMDRLWVSTDNQGICRYDETADRFIPMGWREFVLSTQPDLKADAYMVVYSIRPIAEHRFFLGTNRGAYLFDWRNEKFTLLESENPIPMASGSSSCKGVFYLGSWESDVIRFDPCSNRFERLSLPLDSGEKGSRRYVTQVQPYHDGFCVLGREGLFWMKNDTVHRYLPPPEGKHVLPDGLLRAALVDDEGNLWVGGEKGLWLAEARSQLFDYVQLRDQDFRVMQNHFSAFLSTSESELLAMDFYDCQALRLVNGQVMQRITIGGGASMLKRDGDGSIWMGGGNHLYRLEPGMHSHKEVLIGLDTWKPHPNGIFTAHASDGRGVHYFGHSDEGLITWDQQRGLWSKWGPDNGFHSTSVTCLLHDSTRQCLWIGTMDLGLYHYSYQTGAFTLLRPDSRAPRESLGAYMVRDIAQDSKGRVWVATDPGGVSILNEDAQNFGQFATIRMSHGLPSDRCISLASDARGRMWVGTLNGLACIDHLTGQVHTFTTRDGLINGYLDMPLYSTLGGSMVVGTMCGIQSWNPDLLLGQTWDADVLLTSFMVFDEDRTDKYNSPKDDAISLHWSENFFTVGFATASVAQASRMEYAFRLDGLEEEWNYNGKRNYASYTNVPPGTYHLEVKTGQQGKWMEAGLRIPIVIQTPFWSTWWFRLSCILLLMGGVAGAWRLRLRQVRREESLKAAFSRQLAQTEMAALRAQMNPHFVFNCLSSINRYILVNQPEEASDYLTKFSRLIRLILDNSRSDSVLLARELECLSLYVELERMRFSDHFDFRMEVEPAVQVDVLEIPPMLIQPYVENAIWHGLMHKKGPCLLVVRIMKQGERLRIEVEDNGIGRAKAMELKSRTATTHKSFGMKVTSERMEAINRAYGINASVQTVDLHDAHGQPCGTKIILLI